MFNATPLTARQRLEQYAKKLHSHLGHIAEAIGFRGTSSHHRGGSVIEMPQQVRRMAALMATALLLASCSDAGSEGQDDLAGPLGRKSRS